MVYRKKAAVLSVLVVILALVYTLTLVFDPERQNSQAFSWLDSGSLDLVDGLEIAGSGGTTVLSRKDNIWVFADTDTGGPRRELPVKQARVDDFLAILTQKAVYPLRAASADAGEKLGFGEGNASRILVRGGGGLPLLDLLVGAADALGKEVYLKRADKSEIYSGEDRFTLYTESAPNSWYDLRLFPAASNSPRGNGSASVPARPAGGSGIDAGMVQQAEVSLPGAGEGAAPETFTLRRSGENWVLLGNASAVIDSPKTEAWLRSILEAEGDDFGAAAPAPVEGSVTLRLGNGSSRTIQVGPEDTQKRRTASVSGSSLTYVLAEWTLNRLFRESSYFLKTASEAP